MNLGGRARLGSVADLDSSRRRAAFYHITDELCYLVRRHPQQVCQPHSCRQRQYLLNPCARERGDVHGMRLEVSEAGRDEPLYLPQPLWGYEISCSLDRTKSRPPLGSRAILRSPATMPLWSRPTPRDVGDPTPGGPQG